MRILHTIANLSRTSGGPSRVVTSLCNHLGAVYGKVDILAVGHKMELDEWITPDLDIVSLHTVIGRRIPGLNVQYCPKFSRMITHLNDSQRLDVVHDNGLWLHNNKCSAEATKRLGIPLVITTHGMLEPWALKYRSWKKNAVWSIWQKRAIQGAAVLHATAAKEADNLRALGLKNPIAVVPNGVDVPETFAQHTSNAEHVALFLSRIHPVKGILNLVNAWVKLKPSDWKLVIAGPDEGGHQKEMQEIIDNAGLQSQVEFVGPVEGGDKQRLFEAASLFVLPSFSENFGIVVAESLAAGVPVITTKGTPWSDLTRYDCGWWIDIGVDPLESALREAMSLTDRERLAMGLRGRKLVEENYSWPKIAEDMNRTYRWILDGGPPPECVRFD